jgi:uncharacterized protein (DUF2252 family)
MTQMPAQTARQPGRPARPQRARRPSPARGRARSAPVARLTVERADPQEYVARGRAARSQVPRESHATLDLPASRPDPVGLLERQSATRVPDLVPIRYGRMLASPFAFYRGGALIMANDLALTPATGFVVQACGDAHLSNFGFFASPEQRLVFDVNDFDETLPAPWEWDVKRLATSLEIAARGRGFGRKRRREIVMATVASYRKAMRGLAGLGNLDVWFAQQDVDRLHKRLQSQLALRGRNRAERDLARDPARDNLQELSKLSTMVDGHPVLRAEPPLLVPLADLVSEDEESAQLAAGLHDLITAYRRTLSEDMRVLMRQFDFADIARKVVGVGSVGTRCWVILMTGRDDRDPLFLQVKEASASVLSEFVGASQYANEGQRVVTGQRLMQAAADMFLGWQRVAGPGGTHRDFYVRALRDWRLAPDIDTMTPGSLRAYGQLCGWTLARAHARSGERIAIGAYLGGKDIFDSAVTEFAAAYADQNERDYQLLAKAAKSGAIQATRDI